MPEELTPFGPVTRREFVVEEHMKPRTAACPLCDGTGAIDRKDEEVGMTSEECTLCAGVGQVPESYASEYVNVQIDLWKAQQTIVSQRLRIQMLRGKADTLEAKYLELLRRGAKRLAPRPIALSRRG